MLRLNAVNNGVKEYSGLLSDLTELNTKYVNVEGQEKVSHQGDNALLRDATNGGYKYYEFDEEHNIWGN